MTGLFSSVSVVTQKFALMKIVYTDRKQKSGFLGMGHGRGVAKRDRNKKLFKGMRKLHIAN